VPTVIVTSGANVLSWLDNLEVQAILRGAQRITLAEENEKSEDAERRADEGHAKQIAKIAALTGKSVARWRPPPGIKDLAAYNAALVDETEDALDIPVKPNPATGSPFGPG